MSSIGKTDESWNKHALLRQVVQGQYYAAQRRRPAPALLMDFTAGDGNGVPLPQRDLFLVARSRPTPEILASIAQQSSHARVLLCEKVKWRRVLLATQFPDATILRDSAEAPPWVTQEYAYSLVVSDPNGMGHDDEAMKAIAARAHRSDFVFTINVQAFKRVLGGRPASWQHHPAQVVRNAYAGQGKGWMLDPENWCTFLGKRQAAWTRKIEIASKNFHYRILVVANAMSDVIRRHPDQWELFPSSQE